MLIHLASDVHVNFYSDKGAGLVENIKQAGGADILVLAGDIADARVPDQFHYLFSNMTLLYGGIVVIAGNHEYYGTNREQAHSSIQVAADSFHNVHFLDSSAMRIKGRTFHGGTMWYRDSYFTRIGERYFSDFKQIRGWDTQQKANGWVYRENIRFCDYLRDNLQEGDIVVTHHLPSMKSVAPMYQNDSSNCFFVCEMDDLILERKPSLWLHGHTHVPCDYVLGHTRVVCEPRGYPRERKGWRKYKPKVIQL
jgi:predicted phosphodiesterase